jgi:hypothetical protein
LAITEYIRNVDWAKLNALPRNYGVSSITTADAHNSAASCRLNWRPLADLNGLIRFAERRNMVPARVPSHFKHSLQQYNSTEDSKALGSSDDRRNGSWAIFDLFSYSFRWGTGSGRNIDQTEPLVFPGFCRLPSEPGHMISSFWRGVFALPRCYSTLIGKHRRFETFYDCHLRESSEFRGSLSVPSSGVTCGTYRMPRNVGSWLAISAMQCHKGADSWGLLISPIIAIYRLCVTKLCYFNRLLTVHRDIFYWPCIVIYLRSKNQQDARGKVKAIPLQTWTGPEGCRSLRLPDFKIFATWRW